MAAFWRLGVLRVGVYAFKGIQPCEHPVHRLQHRDAYCAKPCPGGQRNRTLASTPAKNCSCTTVMATCKIGYLAARRICVIVPTSKRALAEFVGTSWLVFGVCGSVCRPPFLAWGSDSWVLLSPSV